MLLNAMGPGTLKVKDQAGAGQAQPPNTQIHLSVLCTCTPQPRRPPSSRGTDRQNADVHVLALQAGQLGAVVPIKVAHQSQSQIA
eukprot:CAMPEP_0175246692 /NCGR_PEP_ID=MMETSP0093-20121207/33234_1 /TAXON_ID=311494 /ORGANISM="Alexandrium monilatum, Strain CCMP3105" /LENGTH=84 /DNA_ID=CAMNT_0016540845 /DNA_START=9 /DNA_END=260 /DNA_ORIENTATION=+